MINLSRHIEVLLLSHDCVVVPEFGGFVVQYVPARYVHEEQLLLPPHRTVSFNAQLTWDDGLLVQSCMQTAGISYPEAVRLVRRAVEELKRTLTTAKTYSFDGIGLLNIGENGLYEFIPNEAGVASPQLYALEALSCPVVAGTAVTSDVASRAANDVQKETTKSTGMVAVDDTSADVAQKKSRSYTLSLNREFCNYVAAAIVAVIFYFLWVTPVGVETNDITTNKAQVFPARIQAKAATKTLGEQKKNVTAQQDAPQHEEQTMTDRAETKSQSTAEATANGHYTIILVSSVKRSNAEAYVSTLHKEGLTEAEVLAKPRMVRVAYGHYATEADAYDTLRKLRKDKRFADAWVMEVND